MSKSSKNYMPVILVLCAVTAGLAIWYNQHQLAATKAEADRVAALRPARPVSVPTAQPEAPPPDAPPPPPADDQAPDPAQQMRDRMAAFMNDPQMQQQMQQRMQAMAQNMYGDVFAQMNLTQDQTNQVNTLLAQRMQAGANVFMTAMQQGLDPQANRDQLIQQVQQAQATVDASIQAVIGADNFSQFQARDQQIRQNFQNGGGPGGGFGGPGGGGPGG